MKNIFLVIGGLIVVGFGIVFISWMLLFFTTFLLLMLIGHVLGTPITVSVRDKVVGEIRWFKYYPRIK